MRPNGPLVVHSVGEWNDYGITVDGADITAALDGQIVNRFHLTGDPQSPRRGLPSTPQEPRFIGLKTPHRPSPVPPAPMEGLARRWR
jgi:hypothetical protein